MNFQDTAKIEIKAGNGGDGIVAWRREKYTTKGGPFGGNGGRGGDILFRASKHLNTLSKFRTQKKWQAEDGQPGATQTKHGRDGQNLIIEVPVGTMIFATDPGFRSARDKNNQNGKTLIADLITDSQEFLAIRGGRGGFGNAHFTSSTRQSPNFAEQGEIIKPQKVELELKLVADIGIIGQPSAGKSTLIGRLSDARPKVGDYPFTTLIPNLGVCNAYGESFVLCDVPGLIKGAAEGKGLGHQFLRHIERCGALLHLVDTSEKSIEQKYQEIRKELKKYSPGLAQKREIVALNKIDLYPDFDNKQKQLEKAANQKIFCISAITGTGIAELITELQKAAQREKEKRLELQIERDNKPVIFQPHLETDPHSWGIEKRSDDFHIIGQRIEQLAIMTNWDQSGGRQRFRDILGKKGIWKELAKRGWQEGENLWVGERNVGKVI